MEVIENLIRQTAFFQDGIDWRNYVMILVAFIFLYLAIKKGYEPLLLLPIAFGMLLANIYPLIIQDGGLLNYFFKLDEWSILPSLIFLGVGAMTDFGPLIANPKSFSSWCGGTVWYFSPLISLLFCGASMVVKQQLFRLSVVLMDRHPFSLPANYSRGI